MPPEAAIPPSRRRPRRGGRFALVPLVALLGGCAVTAAPETGPDVDPYTGYYRQLPESVLAIVAPGQDLSAVQLRDDGCFWYRYEGPVETTMLPLRANGGQPICVARDAETPPADIG